LLCCSRKRATRNALASNFVPALTTGATIALRRTFSASAFFDDLRRFDATYFNTVGRALSYVLATPESSLDRDHRVKFALGPESSPADVKAFRARFGIPVVQGYGQSESVIVLSPAARRRRQARSVCVPGQDVAVVHPTRVSVRTGAVGRALISGSRSARSCAGMPPGASGVLQQQAASVARSTPGWYWSGDLAYRDDDGMFPPGPQPTGCEWTPRILQPPRRTHSRARPAWRPCGVRRSRSDHGEGDGALELRNELRSGNSRRSSASSDLGTKWAPRFVASSCDAGHRCRQGRQKPLSVLRG
jgi:hypothetical protein